MKKSNKNFRFAIIVSLSVHTSIFLGIPQALVKNSIFVDVKQGSSNMQVSFISQGKEVKEENVNNKIQENKNSENFIVKEKNVEEKKNFQEEQKNAANALGVDISVAEGAIVKNSEVNYIENIPPIYPLIAVAKGYEGRVILRVEILKSGYCGKIYIVQSSGYEVLDQSAIDAVKKWMFKPVYAGNTAIPSTVDIPIRFCLKEK